MLWRSRGFKDDGEFVVAGNDEHFDMREQWLCYVFILYINYARLIKFFMVNCLVIIIIFFFFLFGGYTLCKDRVRAFAMRKAL